MKTKKIIPALIILVLMFIIPSCVKDSTPDAVAPEIYFIGDNTVYVVLGATYTDPGATATDAVDGDVSASITAVSNVNTAIKGTYYVTYTVSDAAGNTSTATRIVNVVNAIEYLTGGYSVSDVVTGTHAGTHNYNISVSSSDTVNYKLFIRNFGEFGSSVNVEVTFNQSDSTLNIFSQNPLMMSDPGTISGTGSTSTSAITTINYNCLYTSGGNDNGSATLTKL